MAQVGEELEIVGLKAPVKSTCTGVEMFKKNLDQGQVRHTIHESNQCYLCMHVCTYVRTNVCMYVCMQASMCWHIYIHNLECLRAGFGVYQPVYVYTHLSYTRLSVDTLM